MQAQADRPRRAIDNDPNPAGGAAEPESGESVGRYLSRQRRLRRIGLQELSDITKIPVRSLERLESGHFDGNVDGFVRGFVRTVAEGLGLDPDDTLSRMLSEVRVEDTGRRMPGPGAQRALILAAAALLAVVGVGTIRAVWNATTSRSAAPADERVYWRDPVRDLADSAGLRPAPEIPVSSAGLRPAPEIPVSSADSGSTAIDETIGRSASAPLP